MKKCSHSHHHALAELNITPLLDLAFVLLVIFIITTTPIANDLEIDLPHAAKRQKDPKPKVNYVSVESSGKIYLNKAEVPIDSLREKLVELRLADPDLTVVIRGASKTKYLNIRNVMDALQQAKTALAEAEKAVTAADTALKAPITTEYKPRVNSSFERKYDALSISIRPSVFLGSRLRSASITCVFSM